MHRLGPHGGSSLEDDVLDESIDRFVDDLVELQLVPSTSSMSG